MAGGARTQPHTFLLVGGTFVVKIAEDSALIMRRASELPEEVQCRVLEVIASHHVHGRAGAAGLRGQRHAARR